MKDYATTGFFLLISIWLSAQAKHDYIWLFGTKTQPEYSETGGSVLDFNPSSGNIYSLDMPITLNETNASICDKDGTLLFYTNGCEIVNRNHLIMQNGYNINSGEVHNINCDNYGYEVLGGAMILPLPNDSNSYYLFHLTEAINSNATSLNYSTVDMSKDNGLGKVMVKNQVLVEDVFHKGDLMAVRHANNTDWWVIQPKKSSNTYYKLLFTANGVDSITTQQIGISTLLSGSGQAVFSPDGSYFARYNGIDHVLLFHFDRATGELSDFQQIFVDDPLYIGGVAFSPNGRFLYVSTHTNLFQFDMEAPDIQQSKTFIDTWDGYAVYGLSATTFNRMLLAPDCKIYIAVYGGTPYLHVIQHPDLPGSACDFEQRAIELPTFNRFSMPNFPNYRLGTSYPVCDSNLVISAIPSPPSDFQEPIIYPNPAAGFATLRFPLSDKTRHLTITNMSGQIVQHANLPKMGTEHIIHLQGMPSGIYFIHLAIDGEGIWTGKLAVR